MRVAIFAFRYFVIVIGGKADLAKHQKLTNTEILSVDQKDIADHAVNGAYFYAKHIAQNAKLGKTPLKF